MNLIRQAYDYAPPTVQNIMLSAYGLWLGHLRYGTRHRLLVADLRSSERLGADQWQAKQLSRLTQITAAAEREVPFYKGRLPPGGVSSFDELLGVPVLDKSETQEAGRAMVSTRYARARLQEIHTGGTTGTPLSIFCDRKALQRNYAFFYRIREWAGIARKDRVATFAGRTIIAPRQAAPYWRHNWAARTLLCSSYHLAPDTLDAYIDALVEFRPALIDSYPSSLDAIARGALQRNELRIRPKAVITSSETLFSETRAAAEAAFDCRVFDHYGSAEMVACISQCERGSYHAHPEYGIIEVLVEGRPALPGEAGEIVATGFINEAMPLIRYATGDFAVLGEPGCPCGRSFPVLQSIVGRQDDVLITPEGRRVGRLDPIFKSVQGIYEARIVQDAIDSVRLEVVPRASFSERERLSLIDELQRRLGPSVRISIVSVERIPRTGRGKLRSVVNLLPGRGAAPSM